MEEIDGSVVIPAHNEEDKIDRSLDSLEGQEAEVVVVASGDDRTAEVARSHPATDRVVEDEEGSGPGHARNLGAEEVESEVVLFTDADSEVCDDWVARHLRHYSDEEVVAVGGPVLSRDESLKHRVMFRLLSDYWYRISWPFGFVQISGVNGSYRRSTFLDEGGFDEELPMMEDTELSMRIRKRGEVIYDSDAWVRTSPRRQEGRGYVPLFLDYVKAYTDHYIRGREMDQNYFPSDEVDEDEIYGDTDSQEKS